MQCESDLPGVELDALLVLALLLMTQTLLVLLGKLT